MNNFKTAKMINASLFSLLLLFTACSKIGSAEVDASSVYGELSLSRNESSSNATASATFFVGGGTGTVIMIDSPASVKINGQGANEINEPITGMTSYQRSVSTGTNATIVYEDKNGGMYSNTLLMPGSLSITASSNTVFKSTGFVVDFTSTSGFSAGEKLEITLSSSNTSGFLHYSLVTGAVSGSQTIPSSSLNSFNAGTLTINVCREMHPGAQQPFPKGTSVTVKSCANSKTLNLQP